MKQELFDQLKNKYPELYSELKYIECDDGWFNLIDCLSNVIYRELGRLNKDKSDKNKIVVFQVKEKFGGLRFYIEDNIPNSSRDFIQGAIFMAEDMSFRVCEYCGKPGQKTNSNWIKVLCNTCKLLQ